MPEKSNFAFILRFQNLKTVRMPLFYIMLLRRTIFYGAGSPDSLFGVIVLLGSLLSSGFPIC
jgi:hypothetical protein